ncbi:MAG: NfeD family protein [candidate division KSB1 bacterium]|nr:NfeD family protein [candidate division KSB1 bacterium]MDZ7274814.1 NfeD family protein [candidate division KSB1 bacterium]MDZ7285639.1 NfeD family protein [candidate division KSB1 bacterium]MDZ7298671.1 NfeD family protein [candidate division KSB1 bacterium]MDZ7308790.1 NfeD family protein [candidate division KSB1 bacterium]
MEDWLLWLLVGIVLNILEIFFPGFIPACFGFGCFAAAIAAALDFDLTVQIAVFTATTFIVFLSIRPVFLKVLSRNTHTVATNTERLVGMIGLTLEEVSGLQGQVKLEGEIWSSRSDDGRRLPPGTRVRVLRVEGNKLIVTANGVHPSLN